MLRFYTFSRTVQSGDMASVIDAQNFDGNESEDDNEVYLYTVFL